MQITKRPRLVKTRKAGAFGGALSRALIGVADTKGRAITQKPSSSKKSQKPSRKGRTLASTKKTFLNVFLIIFATRGKKPASKKGQLFALPWAALPFYF